MILTTKGRYAVMAIVDMVANNNIADDGAVLPTSLCAISCRQEITVAYLEQIFCKLKSSGIVKSVRGPGGGYLLAKNARDISIYDILLSAGESVRSRRCEHKNEKGCMKNSSKCATHELWHNLDDLMVGYLRGVNVADICVDAGAL